MEGQAPNLDELMKNLRHQLALYRQLVDLLRDEKAQVIGAQIKELRESTYAKEAILDEINREEQRRLRWVRDAAGFLGMAESDITMEVIASKLGREQFESLMSVKNTLLVFVKKAREMNAETRRLVECALKDAQVMKRNVLGLTSDQPQVYGPKGNMGSAARDNGARLLSKEA